MTDRVLLLSCTLAVLAMGGGGVLAGIVQERMLERVRQRIPDEEDELRRFADLDRGRRILHHFRQLYPGDRLTRIYGYALALGLAGFVAGCLLWIHIHRL